MSLCLTLPTQAAVLVLRHFLDETPAGIYGMLAVSGTGLSLASSGFYGVMVPMVSGARATGPTARRVF